MALMTQRVRSADDPIDVTFSSAELEHEIERITEFIRANVVTTKSYLGREFTYDTALVGLSGGVDSATVAALAVEALGTDSIYCLIMPSRASDSEHISDAKQFAQSLGIEYDVVETPPIVDAIERAVADTTNEAVSDASAQVRRDYAAVNLRSFLLRYLAIGTGGIVVGTANRTEWMTGHFSRYGDGAVDCMPILHLYKTQVFHVARELGVPSKIVDRPPTAGVSFSGTDEENLGVTYDTVDSILSLCVDGGLSRDRTAEMIGVDKEVVTHIRHVCKTSEWQRSLPPAPSPPIDLGTIHE
jgi:NAD+ synthase